MGSLRARWNTFWVAAGSEQGSRNMGKSTTHIARTRFCPRSKSGWLAVGLLAVAVMGIGCSTARIRFNRDASTGLAPDTAITVLLDPWERSAIFFEKRVSGCIQDALEDTHPAMRVIGPGEFRLAAFPELTPEEIPPGDWSWRELTGDPTFRQRIAPLGVRYLIVVSVTEGSYNDGVSGIPIPPFPFLLTAKVWAVMTAEVVDLIHARQAGMVQATGDGTVAFGLIYLFPIIKPAFPIGPACRKLGEGVAKFLSGEEPSPETEAEQSERAAAKTEDPVPPPGDLRTLDWSSTPCC